MLSFRHTVSRFLFPLLLSVLATTAFGQYGFSFDIKKPKEFENRVLRSEKPQKKFTAPRRFIQNTVSHYNYFFNANNKLNEIISRAKLSFREDYAQLLPFYNYSLDVTAADSLELDSVSFKAQTGIVLHDLRSDWADNLYLLWGASYYLKKQFDSAYLMFQFINYAFATKEKDGYYLTIGSARDGNSATSIATKEKNSLPRRLFSEPPSRNDAFIWQVRNYLMQDKYAEASSLILALRNDTAFPSRLRKDLEEVQAYYFYRQKAWDSTAAHLELALGNATNKQERARWEFLLGQLYEKQGRLEQSADFYGKAIAHTTDPIMDVYARLGLVRVDKEEGVDAVGKNIATLERMAKRDKYVDYRDIIYYMAAQMELERNNTEAAINLLLKSTKYVSNNAEQRNKAFLQLAELCYNQRLYRPARNFYDSVQLNDPGITDPDAIMARKAVLIRVVNDLDVLHRQDSVQYLAGLPEDERRGIVRKVARQLRRQQGLKEEDGPVSTGSTLNTQQQNATSLFTDNKKGEWYFYNTTLRQRGQTEFKTRWGTRPNTDNWRRSAAQAAGLRNSQNDNMDPVKSGAYSGINTGAISTEITFDALYDRLPLTEEKMKQSQDSVMNALFRLGTALVQELDDCRTGTDTLESLRMRFPEHPNMDQVLFSLYYCYRKNGENLKATAVKQLMNEKYSHSNLTAIVTTGKDPQGKSRNDEATRAYERVYDQFIEGNFADAIAQKKKLDSTYGRTYWTPQLLYIEAVYYIKQREDSTAKVVLRNIISQFAGQPLAEKATTMLDVLNRRAEIEEELRNLVIVMPAEDTARKAAPPVTYNPPPQVVTPLPADTVAAEPVIKPLQKPVSAIPDSGTTRALRDTAQKSHPTTDSLLNKPAVQLPTLNYQYNAAAPHYVVIVLNKVDPVFVREARNAFAIYNRNNYSTKPLQAELIDVDADNRLILINPFVNAEEALAYVDRTRPKTPTEILPWLRGGKYSFLIISASNLELLKSYKDIDKYKQFLDKNLPGKF
ncbi:MAG: hypothetical protein QM781_06820 [Chitinophagaceae bacterium]